jgi:hypothetical protein
MLNMNEFAKIVAWEECGAKEISIAQIKEVIRIVLSLLADQSEEDALKVIKRYRGRNTK